VLFVFAALLFCESVFAITWCHDYTMFVVTGKDADQTGPGQLETALASDHEIIAPSPTRITSFGSRAAAVSP
jgi:hypothetical protein